MNKEITNLQTRLLELGQPIVVWADSLTIYAASGWVTIHPIFE